MGSYIYKISTEVAFEIMVDGTCANVYKAVYAYKPYIMGWDREEMNARFDRLIVKPTERAFERKGIAPLYFVMAYGDKHKIDYHNGVVTVYHAPRQGITFWDDSYLDYNDNGAGVAGFDGMPFTPKNVENRAKELIKKIAEDTPLIPGERRELVSLGYAVMYSDCSIGLIEKGYQIYLAMCGELARMHG